MPPRTGIQLSGSAVMQPFIPYSRWTLSSHCARLVLWELAQNIGTFPFLWHTFSMFTLAEDKPYKMVRFKLVSGFPMSISSTFPLLIPFVTLSLFKHFLLASMSLQAMYELLDPNSRDLLTEVQNRHQRLKSPSIIPPSAPTDETLLLWRICFHLPFAFTCLSHKHFVNKKRLFPLMEIFFNASAAEVSGGIVFRLSGCPHPW